jgi:hypothetical protein
MANIAAIVTKIDASAESVTLLGISVSGNRNMATIYNNSSQVLYIKYGPDASADSFTVKLLAGDYYELPHPCFTGEISGFWEVAEGSAMVTEII